MLLGGYNDMCINIAVVGVGDFGVKHVELLKENPKANLVAVCRRNEQKVREIASTYNIPRWETDAQKIFEDPDIEAVVIATTEDTHFEFTKQAVSNNKHVLLEKPVCLNLEEGKRLLELVKSTDKIVMPGHILRFDATYSKVKSIIDSGEMGDILSIKVKRNVPRERFSLHSRTHPVFMALAHDIDIILWLSGQFPARVYAMQRSTEPSYNNPDIFFGLIEMKNGILCQLETQWTLPNEYGQYLDVELEVMTRKGHLKLKYPGDNLKVMNEGSLSFPDVTLWPEVHGSTKGALANEIDAFLKLVQGVEKQQVITVEEAVNGIKVGHMLIRSADEQKEIRV